MNRLLSWFQWANVMGFRYLTFRLLYEIQLRSGLLRLQFPVSPPKQEWISLQKWRSNPEPFFFESGKSFDGKIQPNAKLHEEALRIKNGEIQFFNGDWRKLDLDEWLLNPSTGHRYSIEKHWTEIPDFNIAFGDIKYVWEKSRFNFLQTILRDDSANQQDSSEWVFLQIESWIENNPINRGPNYRCSQEISLRIFNWILALYFYKDSPQLTEARFKDILFSMYWQLKHVRSNIHFSRIAVRNNHAITETLGLYTGGLLFPFFKEADEWKRKGKKWLEEELLYQVYPDGSYLQYSFNYHRVAVQLMTWALSLAHIHQEKFIKDVYDRAHRSVNLLAACQDSISGQLPNFGANDGSLFFKWNDKHFRDFRPCLDAIHFLLTSQNLYSDSYEDRHWFGAPANLTQMPKIEITEGTFSFDLGGIYICRWGDLLVFINCAQYRNRPSQADNLHMDVWYKGVNILRDAGSYQYNTDPALVKYFFGTESHNSVMIGDADQMVKGTRFIWFNWSKAIHAVWTEEEGYFKFDGTILAFAQLGSISCKREIKIYKHRNLIEINDSVEPIINFEVRQIWHLNPDYRNAVRFHTQDKFSKELMAKEKMGLYSDTYGQKADCPQLEFITSTNLVRTQMEFDV